MKIKTLECVVDGYVAQNPTGELVLFDEMPVYGIHDEEWKGREISHDLTQFFEDLTREGDVAYISFQVKIIDGERLVDERK